MRCAIEWARKAWEQLSVKTVRNCWNHAKILSVPVLATGPDDTEVNELKDLLLEFSAQAQDSSLRVEDVLDDPTEAWTAAPVESDDEDADLRAAFQARAESDEDEADVNEVVMPMTLRDARIAAQAVKVFVQKNQAVEVMHGYLKPIEDLVSDLEAMTVSVRTQQTRA